MTASRSRLWIILMIVSGMIAGFGVYRQVEGRSDDGAAPVGAEDLAPLAPAPFAVSVTPVVDTPRAAVGVPQPISVTAVGDGVGELVLYDGDRVIGRAPITGGEDGTPVTQLFDWPPLAPGDHVLHAAAVGADPTQVAHSAPVRIMAVDPVVPGTPPDLPDPPPPAGAPETVIEVTQDGCGANIAPESGTVSVYETGGGGPGFRLLGTASASEPLSTGDLTPGTHVFVAGPEGAPADSAPVAVTAADDCLADLWSGEATLFDGALRLPEPAPNMWVYLGVDGEAFQRVPATGAVSAPDGNVDLTGVLPALSGKTVKLQVWEAGASPGAPATLVAQSETVASDGLTVSDIIGEPVSLSLRSNVSTMEVTTKEVTFNWDSSSTRIDAVQWQLLARPLSVGDRGISSPLLLGSGISETGSGKGIQVVAGTSGAFTIPAATLLAGRTPDTPPTAVVASATPTLADLKIGSSPVTATQVTPAQLGEINDVSSYLTPMPIGDVFVRVLPLSGTTVIGDASPTLGITLPALSGKYAGFTPTSITLDPGRAANHDLYNCIRVTEVGPLDRPTLADGTPFAAFYPTPGTYCPNDWERDDGSCDFWCTVVEDLGSVVSFLATVWDGIAYLYNGIVDLAVDLIANLNPFCLTAKVGAAVVKSGIADDISEGCEAVGRVVGRAIVTAVLTSFGLPPSLPTSAELAAIATGNLKALALAYLKQLGVPCDEMTVPAEGLQAAELAGVDPDLPKEPDGSVSVCGAMIDAVADQMTSEIKAIGKTQIANTTGMPPTSDPATTVIIEPRSKYTGATVDIVGAPIDPATPMDASCAVQARGTFPSWDVGGFEQTKYREIYPGSNPVKYNAFSAFVGQAPWTSTINLTRKHDIYDGELLTVSLTSQCLSGYQTGAILPPQYVHPALGRWSPGQED